MAYRPSGLLEAVYMAYRPLAYLRPVCLAYRPLAYLRPCLSVQEQIPKPERAWVYVLRKVVDPRRIELLTS